MVSYLIKRLLLAIPAVLGVVVVVFVLMRLIPGDVVTQLVGMQGNVSAEQLENMRRVYGLDLPLYKQFYVWFIGVVQGDFGTSLRTGRPILQDLLGRFPVTLELATLSIAISLVLALPLGLAAAWWRGSWIDGVLSVLALLGLSVPGFFLGIMLVYVFSLKLAWLPPASFVPWTESPAQNLRHMILPALSLGFIYAAATMRMVRASLLSVLPKDYMRTAKAKGLADTVRLYKHGLRNALIPVITTVGLQFGTLLGGAVVIEEVFSLPGVGRYALEGINNRDYPMIQATVLFIALAFILVNLLVDVLYVLADPRIRFD